MFTLVKRPDTTFGGKGTCNLKCEKMLQVDSSSLINKTVGIRSERNLWISKNYPFRIRLYVLRKGIPRTNPMTWGWDLSTINPTRWGGVWILRDRNLWTFVWICNLHWWCQGAFKMPHAFLFFLISSFKETTNEEQYYSTLQKYVYYFLMYKRNFLVHVVL